MRTHRIAFHKGSPAAFNWVLFHRASSPAAAFCEDRRRARTKLRWILLLSASYATPRESGWVGAKKNPAWEPSQPGLLGRCDEVSQTEAVGLIQFAIPIVALR